MTNEIIACAAVNGFDVASMLDDPAAAMRLEMSATALQASLLQDAAERRRVIAVGVSEGGDPFVIRTGQN